MHIKATDIVFKEKRWGYERWITNNDLYCGKELFIAKGHFLSFHFHLVKDEVLYVQKGKIYFTWQEEEDKSPRWMILPAGEAFHVTPNVKHQMEAIEDSWIYEWSTTHSDEDSYRVTTDLVINHQDDGK